MVACCRLVEAEFFDPRIHRAVEAAERWADDPQAEEVASAIWRELTVSPQPQLPQSGPEGEIAGIIAGAWQVLDEWADAEFYINARHAISHAVYLCLRQLPREVFTGGDGNAAEYCARVIACADSMVAGSIPKRIEDEDDEIGTETEIRRSIADILRDIFGNPFRPRTLEPAWLTSTVRALAEGIYTARAFDRMPILADALEDAGCDSEDILNHCRGDGPHVRGCWVIDLVLNKS
jgi:hypothetical protein